VQTLLVNARTFNGLSSNAGCERSGCKVGLPAALIKIRHQSVISGCRTSPKAAITRAAKFLFIQRLPSVDEASSILLAAPLNSDFRVFAHFAFSRQNPSSVAFNLTPDSPPHRTPAAAVHPSHPGGSRARLR